MKLHTMARHKAAVLLALSFLIGCEDDKGIGDGHDFRDNDPGVVLALGDSITEGHDLSAENTYPAQLAPMIGKTVINQGSGGQRSAGGRSRVDGVLRQYKPGFVLIFYGANDVIHDVPHEDTIANLREMISAAKANSTVPVVATLLPAYTEHTYMQGGISRLNPMIRELASAEGVALADMESAFGSDESLLQDDGLHPSESGARLIAQVFAGMF
ncbi:SGNH/GDSL hydrolase family protein [Verrucomicrobiota bacterium]